MEIEKKNSTSITLPCIAKKNQKEQTVTWCHHTDFWALLLPWEVTWWNAVSAEGTIIYFFKKSFFNRKSSPYWIETAEKCSRVSGSPGRNDGRRLAEALGKISCSTRKNSRTERNPSEKSWQLDNSECSCCDGSKAAKIWNIHHRASWNGLTQEGQTVCCGFFNMTPLGDNVL